LSGRRKLEFCCLFRETDFSDPETASQNLAFGPVAVSVENVALAKCPPVARQYAAFKKSAPTQDCVVVHASVIERVSVRDFPANREKNREFRQNTPPARQQLAKSG